MAIMSQHLSTATNFPKSTHLNSMADRSALALGEIDMSTNDYPNAKIRLSIELSTALDPGGTVDVYFSGSLDGTNYTDNITPASTASQSTKLQNSQMIKSLKADGDMEGLNIDWVAHDMYQLIGGDLPPYWTLLVHNQSGAVLGSTNTAHYVTASYKGST